MGNKWNLSIHWNKLQNIIHQKLNSKNMIWMKIYLFFPKKIISKLRIPEKKT